MTQISYPQAISLILVASEENVSILRTAAPRYNVDRFFQEAAASRNSFLASIALSVFGIAVESLTEHKWVAVVIAACGGAGVGTSAMEIHAAAKTLTNFFEYID
jgi:hypothetical protein